MTIYSAEISLRNSVDVDKPPRVVEDVEVGTAGKTTSELRKCPFRQAVRKDSGQAILSNLQYLR